MDFVQHLVILRTFQKLDLFASSCVGKKTPALLGPVISSLQSSSRLSLEDGNGSNFRSIVFCSFRMPDNGQSPETW
jgi:hypothetical protein